MSHTHSSVCLKERLGQCMQSGHYLFVLFRPPSLSYASYPPHFHYSLVYLPSSFCHLIFIFFFQFPLNLQSLFLFFPLLLLCLCFCFTHASSNCRSSSSSLPSFLHDFILLFLPSVLFFTTLYIFILLLLFTSVLSVLLLLPVCSSAPINMKVQHVNGSTLVVSWARPEVTYHPPILHFLVSYSWTTHDDSYEETRLTDAKHKLVSLLWES